MVPESSALLGILDIEMLDILSVKCSKIDPKNKMERSANNGEKRIPMQIKIFSTNPMGTNKYKYKIDYFVAGSEKEVKWLASAEQKNNS